MSSTATDFIWNPSLSGVASRLIELVDSTVEDGGLLGYERRMTAEQGHDFLDALARRIDRGETDLLIGKSDGVPVMMVQMTRNTMPNCRHTAELSKGVVHPDARGRNLVPLAFKALAEMALGRGIEQFVLDVRENSRAHLLWQRFGFATYGVLDDYARIDGSIHRGHFMAQPVRALADRLARVQTSFS